MSKTYLLQRASNDLDFNTTIQNPNALMLKIEDINSQLETQEIAIEMQGIPYGFFEFVSGCYPYMLPTRGSKWD